MKVRQYRVTVRHDAGRTTIVTAATSKQSAKETIMMVENCPEHAITDIYLNTPYNQIVCEVNGRYGAPMGRHSHGIRPKRGKIYDKAVPLYDGAYDRGGAYWGSPSNLRVRFTKDLSYVEFYRTF
jgi:hypothetical protein